MSSEARPAIRTVNAKIIRSTSLIAPAVRMVVIEAWAWQVGDEPMHVAHDIFPVIAIRQTLVDRYYKEVPAGTWDDAEQNHAEMVEQGWWFGESEIEENPIIHTEDYDLCDAAFAKADNSVEKVVVCPWPQSEDEERLAGIIAELREAAPAKCSTLGQRVHS